MNDLRELLRKPDGAKAENRHKILRAIMATSSNQTDLVRRSGMSPATVSQTVKDLEDDGIVECERKGPNVFVSMTPAVGLAIGVELGFQNMIVVARHVHEPHDASTVRMRNIGATAGLDRWLETLVELIQEVSTEAAGGIGDVATVGVGVPRMVDPRTGKLTPPLLPPWEGIPSPVKVMTDRLRDEARKHGLELPAGLLVRLDNDATLGALAESTYAYPRKETLVFVKASTGVGAGIIISGRVFRGRRGVAGEIGHTTVDREGRFCLCGGRGCLETIVGSNRLLKQAAVLERPPTTMDELIDRAKDNALCRRILQEAAGRLGRAIGDVCNVLNPDVVVLGGPLARGEELVLEPCRAGLRESAVAAAYEDEFELVASVVKHASAHGALLLGIDGTVY